MTNAQKKKNQQKKKNRKMRNSAQAPSTLSVHTKPKYYKESSDARPVNMLSGMVVMAVPEKSLCKCPIEIAFVSIRWFGQYKATLTTQHTNRSAGPGLQK